MKRRLLLSLAAAPALLGACAMPGAPSETAVPEAQVRSSGRVVAAADGGWLATWPGVSWSLRLRGSAVGVRLDDALNHWVLEVDGRPRLQIAPSAGPRTVWLRDLGPGEHELQLIKKTESPQQAARVLGFVVEGQVLPPPAAPARRIEFIGDSYTAAMGNMSPSRQCTGAEISARTDITQGYAVLAARALGAEWRVHAKSGMGLVRNWNGGVPHETHGTHYARQLQSDPASRVGEDGWRAQTVVIGLGTNDFSTPVRAGEPRDAATLEREVAAAYRRLIEQVLTRNANPRLVLLTVPLPGNGDKLRPLVQGLAAEQRALGRRVDVLDWGATTAGGCGSHPDAGDHRRMAEALVKLLSQ